LQGVLKLTKEEKEFKEKININKKIIKKQRRKEFLTNSLNKINDGLQLL
jgi:hypothetical protein